MNSWLVVQYVLSYKERITHELILESVQHVAVYGGVNIAMGGVSKQDLTNSIEIVCLI